MADIPSNIAELDSRIAAARENLRELIEQAAAYSGAADDDSASRRIAEQEALLARLMMERDIEASRIMLQPDREQKGK
jgi:hypothetical protein